MKSIQRPLAFLLLVFASFAGAAAKTGSEHEHVAADRIPVGEWLLLGPVPYPLPVFLGEDDAVELDQLLGDAPFSGDWPRPSSGTELAWFGGERLRWAPDAADRRGELALTPPTSEPPLPALALLASYVTVDRWVEVELEVLGSQARCAWIDGELAVDCGGTEGAHARDKSEEPTRSKGEDEKERKHKHRKKKKKEAERNDGKVEDTLDLAPGTHLLVIQTVWDPRRGRPWSCGAVLTPRKGGTRADIALSTGAERDLDIRDILDPPRITSLALAPDGRRLVASYSRFVPGGDDEEIWIEIRRIPGGERLESWRVGPHGGKVAWSSDGRFVSYVSGEDEDRSTLYLRDLETGRTVPLLDDVEKLEGYRWSPTSRVIAYWTTDEVDRDELEVKRLEGLMDRWASFRDKQYLHLVTVPDGVTRRITAGDLTTQARDFSPDGRRLLFTRQVEDLAERPYSKYELWELDLATLRATKERDFRWLEDVSYAPDGRRLLVRAAPAEFGEAGLDLPLGAIVNSYDTELFVWDPAADEVDAITRDFDPTVLDAQWSPQDDRIYLVAADRDYRRLYRYDATHRSFTALDSGFEFVDRWTLAERASVAAVVGSSSWEPEGLAALDLRAASATRARHPADAAFAGVRRGTVESWSFTAASGRPIDGRVYLPPGFDPQRKYPCIVFYYGGTTPTDRAFGGRYPKEWWAARGYVVYVLQPSGATGFGQPFSASHVNDWGKTSSKEIIEGTRKFLAAHPAVDAARVGCIGASYGGFVTMLLTTEPDLFAAAVAHAGISSIASYWGEGYWGYSYSAVATAGSFPWNRPDIYVEQSPLYHADQVRVPILLTHGRADTNVPVGESDAFYVALKLLGKPVEYVQIEGQDHWIVDHDKRIVWSNTILAWFDRWLKGQPEWWDDLYPPRNGE